MVKYAFSGGNVGAFNSADDDDADSIDLSTICRKEGKGGTVTVDASHKRCNDMGEPRGRFNSGALCGGIFDSGSATFTPNSSESETNDFVDEVSDVSLCMRNICKQFFNRDTLLTRFACNTDVSLTGTTIAHCRNRIWIASRTVEKTSQSKRPNSFSFDIEGEEK